jgi:ribonucleoside-diphosphate reductase beta chain
VIAGYQHFLRLASRVQWDEADIDLSADAAAWPEVADDRLKELVAGFLVGEEGVAEHLGHFFTVRYAKEVFDVQRRDEERHARFFARYVDTVNFTNPRAYVRGEFAEWFDVRLPAAAARSGVEAVGLYHMILEGVVFTAGQYALLERLQDGRLPGLKQGMELVLRDEKWHVGFGTRCLADAQLADADVEAILAEGERAAAAWAPEQAERVVSTLRRRMAAVRR